MAKKTNDKKTDNKKTEDKKIEDKKTASKSTADPVKKTVEKKTGVAKKATPSTKQDVSPTVKPAAAKQATSDVSDVAMTNPSMDSAQVTVDDAITVSQSDKRSTDDQPLVLDGDPQDTASDLASAEPQTKIQTSFNDPLSAIDPVLINAFSEAPSETLPVNQDASENAESTDILDSVENATVVEQADMSDSDSNSTNMDDANSATIDVSDVQFPDIVESAGTESSVSKDVFGSIPVEISVELGRSNVSLKEAYELKEGSILELDRYVGEALDIVLNGQVIASGEVVAIDDHYAIRVTKVHSPVNA